MNAANFESPILGCPNVIELLISTPFFINIIVVKVVRAEPRLWPVVFTEKSG